MFFLPSFLLSFLPSQPSRCEIGFDDDVIGNQDEALNHQNQLIEQAKERLKFRSKSRGGAVNREDMLGLIEKFTKMGGVRVSGILDLEKLKPEEVSVIDDARLSLEVARLEAKAHGGQHTIPSWAFG